jgi:hypothetical protein
MSLYHLVQDHPFMAVTDKDGNFRIEGLPVGAHKFRVWHERGGLLEKDDKVDVKDGAEKTLKLKYPVAKFAGKKEGLISAAACELVDCSCLSVLCSTFLRLW